MSKRAGSAPKAAKPKAPATTSQTQRGGKVPQRPHKAPQAGSIPAAATTDATTAKAPAGKKAPAKSKPPEPGPATQPVPGHQASASLSSAVLDHLAALKPGPKRFAVEYLRDHNATQAYIRAGYSARGNSAEVNANRLLRNAQVSAAIAKAEAEMLAQVQEETGITLKRTLEYIARGAFHDPRKFFRETGELVPITDLDDITASALAGFEVTEVGGRGEDAVVRFISKAKLADRKGYLDMLMKHLGGYKKDNEQSQTPLAEAMRDFIGSLHQAGSRLPIAPRA